VQVGGLIAAVGSRLVEAAAKKQADDFFRALSDALDDRHAVNETDR
jgi:carbon monoxide dehydrogenase subunit G